MKLPLKAKQFYQKFLNTDNKKSVFILVFWAFASKGLGLLREALIGRLPTIQANMFGLASTLNENIVTILILGTIATGALPQVIALDNLEDTSENNQKRINHYLSWTGLLLTIVITILCAIGIIWSREFLILLNADSYDGIKNAGLENEYIRLNQIFLVAPIIFAIKTILGIFLNARKSFKIYSLDGVLSNIGLIIGLTFLYSVWGIVGAGFGLLLGFCFALIGFIIDCYKHNLRFDLNGIGEIKPYLWKTLWLFLPRLLVINSARTAETLMATINRSDDGVAIFRLSMNIQGIFYGIVLMAGTVFLPDLTNLLHKPGSKSEFWQKLNKYLSNSLKFSFFAVILTLLITPVLVYLIKVLSFSKSGSLLASDQTIYFTIGLVAIGSIAIIFQSVNEILGKYFIAIQDNKFSIISTIVANVLSVVLTLVLMQNINRPVAVMIGYILNNAVLAGMFYWRVQRDKCQLIEVK